MWNLYLAKVMVYVLSGFLFLVESKTTFERGSESWSGKRSRRLWTFRHFGWNMWGQGHFSTSWYMRRRRNFGKYKLRGLRNFCYSKLFRLLRNGGRNGVNWLGRLRCFWISMCRKYLWFRCCLRELQHSGRRYWFRSLARLKLSSRLH